MSRNAKVKRKKSCERGAIDLFFLQAEKEALGRIRRFHDSLLRLRYEGKPLFGRNVRETRRLYRLFQDDLRRHIRLEEKALYPFLRVHLPKLGPALFLLHSDHQEIQRNLTHFGEWLKGLRRSGGDGRRRDLIGKMKECGIYLTHFLESHAHVEGVIRHIAECELRPREKRGLEHKLKAAVSLRGN